MYRVSTDQICTPLAQLQVKPTRSRRIRRRQSSSSTSTATAQSVGISATTCQPISKTASLEKEALNHRHMPPSPPSSRSSQEDDERTTTTEQQCTVTANPVGPIETSASATHIDIPLGNQRRGRTDCTGLASESNATSSTLKSRAADGLLSLMRQGR